MRSLDVPRIPVVGGNPLTVPGDWLVVPVFEADELAVAAWLDPVTGGALGRALGTREFSGKPHELLIANLTGGTPVTRVAVLGAGPRPAFSLDRVRRLASQGALAIRERRGTALTFVLTGELPAADEAQAAAEGLALAAFDGGAYKTDADVRKDAPSCTLAVRAGDERIPADVAMRAERGSLLGACSNLARELANEPANALTPRTFCDRAAAIAAGTDLALDVLDESRIAGLGMGMVLGVAQGSSEPPRVLVLRYAPPVADLPTTVLGLVGKGVTFDSGGISIKPSEGMHRMKTDMSGGAAVVAAMRAITALRPAIGVVGVVPLAENMPGGRAMRPGDIVRSAEGKTVEVLDTDAEGRLLLGDGLWYARQLGATHLVDVATLTGACAVALGRTTSGAFGGPDWWLDLVVRTANRSGDRSWPLPTFEDYRDQLRSEIADMVNVGGRPAGAITAAMFLREFTGRLPWVHMDIAGTAWSDEAQPYQPKGPTGVAVRTLAELTLTAREWGK